MSLQKIQYVYLDFDGAETTYNGELLTIDRVNVLPSGFSAEQIAEIVSVLNEKYNGIAIFSDRIPAESDYSTIYVGASNAFERYGNFAGLAETIDQGNKNRNDNAFVMADCNTPLNQVIALIDHEAGHIVSGIAHVDYTGTLRDYAAVVHNVNGVYFDWDNYWDNQWDGNWNGPEPGDVIPQHGSIKGSSESDIYIFSSGECSFVKDIDTGAGNDQIILEDACVEAEVGIGTYEYDGHYWNLNRGNIVTGSGHDEIYIGENSDIDAKKVFMGDGNDAVSVMKHADCVLESMDMGAGDDKIRVTAHGEIRVNDLYFGSGNDSLIVDNDGWIEGFGGPAFIYMGDGGDNVYVGNESALHTPGIDLGNGDDTLTVDVNGTVTCRKLDFGSGNDTLVLNGGLLVHGWWSYDNDYAITISGLENISGSGWLGVEESDDGVLSVTDRDIQRFQKAGIEVVNTFGSDEFAGKKEELSDNSIANAATGIIKYDGDIDHDIWLCGKNKAANMQYGFADEVDYVKFAKIGDTVVEFDNFNGSSVKVDLLNSNGKVVTSWDVISDLEYSYGECEYSLKNYTDGTYYLKLTVGSDHCTYGDFQIKYCDVPDLLIKDYTLTEKGDSLQLSFKLANAGEYQAANSTVSVFCDDKLLKTVTMGSVSADSYLKGNISISKNCLKNGVNKIYLVADNGNKIRESAEDNNTASRVVVFNGPLTRDLKISKFTVSAKGTTADAVKLNFTVSNNGNTTAGASKAYIYDGNTKLGEVSVDAIGAGDRADCSYTIAAGRLKVGTHSLKIVADGAKKVAETNENNNTVTYTKKIVQATYDLQASGLSVGIDKSKDVVKLSFTVKNAGNVALGATKAYIYDGSKKIGTVNVAALAGGASKAYAYSVAAGKLGTGNHSFKVMVDGAKAVKENNEKNNTLSKSLNLTRDLQASGLSVGIDKSKDVVKLSFTVKNTGNAAVGASKAYIYDGSKKIGTVNVAALAGGASKAYAYSVAAGKLGTGNHSFKAMVDGTKAVKENNEKNNTLSKKVTLNRDLQVAAVSVGAADINTGATKISFTVKNAGNISAGANKAYIYDGSKVIASVAVAALGAGAGKSYSYTLAAGKLAAGTHTLKVVVDGANAVKESNEKNNSLAKSVSIAKGRNTTIGGIALWDGDIDIYIDTYKLDEYKKDGSISEYDKDLPAASKYGGIKGTVSNDVITFAANKSRKTTGIALGAGNDKIAFASSSAKYSSVSWADKVTMGNGNDTFAVGANTWFGSCLVDLGSGNDTLSVKGVESEVEFDVLKCGAGDDTITVSGADAELDYLLLDMGSGNDKLTVTNFGEFDDFDVFDNRDGESVFFGDGNDVFTISNGAEVEIYRGMDFGNGHDKLNITAGGKMWLTSDVYFGAGNDTLSIAANGRCVVYGSVLNFGSGTDTLHIDGVLDIDGIKGISGVEKVTGSGTVAMDLTKDQDTAWIEELLAGSEVEIINDLGMVGFRGLNEELGDNKISGASVLEVNKAKNGAVDVDFWLCGAEVAKGVDRGLADAVDYVKFVKNSANEELCFYLDQHIGRDGYLTVEVFDANGKRLTGEKYSTDVLADYGSLDVSEWKNGTYYLKLATTSTGAISGIVCVDD